MKAPEVKIDESTNGRYFLEVNTRRHTSIMAWDYGEQPGMYAPVCFFRLSLEELTEMATAILGRVAEIMGEKAKAEGGADDQSHHSS